MEVRQGPEQRPRRTDSSGTEVERGAPQSQCLGWVSQGVFSFHRSELDTADEAFMLSRSEQGINACVALRKAIL